MEDRSSPHPLSFWVEVLKNDILLSEVNDDAAAALCGHLADLGVLEKSGREGLRLALCPEGSFQIEEELERRLNELCLTEKGFALRYFLKTPPAPLITSDSQEQKISRENPKSNPQLLGQKTSNLSNLQLVKKYGRQVQSFIELEKSYTERLLGSNTNLKEARKIFNFILSRMKQKTEPRPWEQLSRRRHK